MPHVNIDNDQYTFRMEIMNKGELFIDGMKMSAQILADDDPERFNGQGSDIAELVRKCAWVPEKGNIDVFDEFDLTAAGLRVMKALEELGNAQGLSPALRQPTEAFRHTPAQRSA